MSVQLLRNTRVFVSTVLTGFTAANTFEILVGDDLSFGQTSSNTDITLDEAGPQPIRGSRRFTDAIDPGEWTFSNYILPIHAADAGAKVSTPDAILWHCLSSGSTFNPAVKEKGVFQDKMNQVVSFKDSQYHELAKAHLFMLVDSVWFKAENLQVNTAEINVDISDIARITWSGNAGLIEALAAQPFDPNTLGISDAEFIRLQPSYIKNKLSILKIVDNASGGVTYDKIGITGATITISNNISYLTPNTLNRVDRPIGYFTGGLEVTGSLECYLNDIANGSSDLWKKLTQSTGQVNSHKLQLMIGGYYATSQVPGIVVHLPKAHLSVPELQTEDAMGLNIEFKGMGTDMSSGDEVRFCMAPDLNQTKIDQFLTTGFVTVV